MGPVFTREALIAPRRPRLYIARAAYVSMLLALMAAGWLVLTGTQLIRNVGDLAVFGATVFQILAPLQIAVVIFFSALSAASAVALEKDRRTLELLLLTNLTSSELVLGKLLASLLNAVVLTISALPLFMLMVLLGGVSFQQVGAAFAVTLASTLAAGSLGSTLALWREKTFQTLAMTVLAIVFWIGIWEAVAAGSFGITWGGVSTKTWAIGLSPWQAILAATRPYADVDPALGMIQTPVNLFLIVAVVGTLLLTLFTIYMVRIWNPSREVVLPKTDENAETKEAGQTATADVSITTRQVWDNPILWREMRTWAYGRKILVVRLAYVALVCLAAAALYLSIQATPRISREEASLALAPLLVLSLVLVNAQAVTALTSERDARALDLLLVTDLTPKEFIFGKLGGILFNTKEMVLLPLLLILYLAATRNLTLENTFYLVIGLLVMHAFVAMLGVHAGMTYGNSRTAIAVSLGTVFFLFVGVAACMRVLVAFQGRFEFQMFPFVALIGGGSVGLYAVLGLRNPSPAIAMASAFCPAATFYCIMSFLLDSPLAVFFVVCATYGFASLAMLIPAIYEFDVATGRTTGGDE